MISNSWSQHHATILGTLQWHHMSLRKRNCFFKRLFQLTAKKSSRSILLAFCDENTLLTGGLLGQRISDAENDSISWGFHEDNTQKLHHSYAESLSWWRHQMEAVSALLALCAENPPVTGGFPAQRASNVGLDFFFDVSLIKWLNKQMSRQWFETTWCTLWRHCNDLFCFVIMWYLVIHPYHSRATILVAMQNR